jgi:Skp family chaperone for outer membrane proteins
MKLDKLGWVVAAGLAGAMFGMGLQPASPKFASVDIAKVFDQSDQTRTSRAELQDFQTSRLEILTFLQQNQAMKPDDAKKYAQLSVKAPKTPADDTELTRIKADAENASTRQRGLSFKQNPTAEDTKELSDFGARAAQNHELIGNLDQQFRAETEQKQKSLMDVSMQKVRDAIRDVASKQGYTIVFSSETAPYASNDLTADALKAVKK